MSQPAVVSSMEAAPLPASPPITFESYCNQPPLDAQPPTIHVVDGRFLEICQSVVRLTETQQIIFNALANNRTATLARRDIMDIGGNSAEMNQLSISNGIVRLKAKLVIGDVCLINTIGSKRNARHELDRDVLIMHKDIKDLPVLRAARPRPRLVEPSIEHSVKKKERTLIDGVLYPAPEKIADYAVKDRLVDTVALVCKREIIEKMAGRSTEESRKQLERALTWLMRALAPATWSIRQKYFGNTRMDDTDFEQIIKENLLASILTSYDPRNRDYVKFRSFYLSTGWRRLSDNYGENISQLSTPKGGVRRTNGDLGVNRVLGAISYNDTVRMGLPEGAEPTFYEELLPAGKLNTEAIVLQREKMAVIYRAIARMTPIEKVAIVGSIDGKSYDELVSESGYNIKALDNAVQRARRKLRRILSEQELES